MEKTVETFIHILNDAKAREDDAISSLYQHFHSRILRYIYYRVPDRNVAEDLTSDVFLRMIEEIHAVKATNEDKFARWLFQIARNSIADYYYDREKILSCVSLDSIGDSIEYLCILADNTHELQKHLARVFCALTEEQRIVLTAILMMDYDAESTGKIIGKNANAVRALKYRAITSLRRILNEKGDYDGDHSVLRR